MATAHDCLFEPVQIGPVTAPNRFFAVPHATGHGWSQPSGAIALRAMKAEGGWGTVAVQMTEISPDSDLANHQMDRIWDASDVPRHAAQVAAIKRHGSLAAIELAHGGMRARNLTTGTPVPGPSALPILRPEVPLQARAMDLADIRAFREAHKAAARRATEAGYDILYVYAAHDLSLLSHFLSVRTNHRTDAYGGSLRNRVRLLREVLEDTADVAAAGTCAVALRFSVAEPGRPGGLTHDGEGRDIVEALADLPDLWDVNIAGWPEDSQTARFADEGYQLPYVTFVKSITDKPVVGVGRFTSPDLMANLVRRGTLDLIGGARPSIADPFLPAKIRDGRIDDIRECIGCNICVSMDSYGVPVRCTQNPTVSEEWQRGWHPEAPALPRIGRQTHLVIGAGPAGLDCALTLARAGQKVVLAEARAVAGGRVTQEAALPGLATWARVRDHRLHRLRSCAEAEVYLSSPMSADDVADVGADTITFATGARWRSDGVGATGFRPIDLSGITVLTPDDVMAGAVPDTPGAITVYDDDHFYMASVLAEALCQAGHNVTYVTPMPTVAPWTDHTLEQGRIVARLAALGVGLRCNVGLGTDPRWRDTLSGAAVDMATDTLVLVGARLPDDALFAALQARSGIGALYRAGDCLAPGIIQAAVLSGHAVARRILNGGTSPPLRRDQAPPLA